MKAMTSREKNIQRFPSRPGRTIYVEASDTVWKWTVSSRGGVLAYSRQGDRRCAYASTVKGVTPDTFDRGQHKRTRDGMVTPKEVAAWLASVPGEG